MHDIIFLFYKDEYRSIFFLCNFITQSCSFSASVSVYDMCVGMYVGMFTYMGMFTCI